MKFLEKAIELESLGKAFKSVGVSSVMTEANCNMMVEFADYIINEINADTISVTPVVVDTKAKSNHVYLDSESELNAYENIALYVRKYNLENRINVNCTTPYLAEYLNYKYGTHFEILPKGCDAGESSVYIDSQGHIKPCRYSDEIASLQCDKVSDIYGKSETFIKLKSNIRPMNCDCIYSKCCNICLLAEKDKLQKSNLCKCIAKRYDISHKATVDQFIFDEPHVFYETESGYVAIFPRLNMKETYSREGYDILNSLSNVSMTAHNISQIVCVETTLVYRFLIQSFSKGIVRRL